MPKEAVFQFKKGRRASRVEKDKDKTYDVKPREEPPIQPVQGIMPASVQEWRVALALYRLGLSFYYQYEVFGGRSLRGGQIIDFWVFTVPLPTPVYVQGDYWHRGSKEMQDALKVADLKRRYQGQIAEPLLVWEHELTSMDEAYKTMKGGLLNR
jgi:hypothetical protein